MSVSKKIIIFILTLAMMGKVWEYVGDKIETPSGYCKEKNEYVNDQDFIYLAIYGYQKSIKNYRINEDTPESYFENNKGCCRVIRKDEKLSDRILYNEPNSTYHVDMVFEKINKYDDKKHYYHINLIYDACGKLIDLVKNTEKYTTNYNFE